MNAAEPEGVKVHPISDSTSDARKVAVLIVYGLPGCGKSTLANALKERRTYRGRAISVTSLEFDDEFFATGGGSAFSGTSSRIKGNIKEGVAHAGPGEVDQGPTQTKEGVAYAGPGDVDQGPTQTKEGVAHAGPGDVDQGPTQTKEGAAHAGPGDVDQGPTQTKEGVAHAGPGGHSPTSFDPVEWHRAQHRFQEKVRQWLLHSLSTSRQSESESSAAMNILCIVDNFYRYSMRWQWLKLLREVHSMHLKEEGQPRALAHLGTVFVDCPVEVCIQRNALRTGVARVPEGVIASQASKLNTDPLQLSHRHKELSTGTQPFNPTSSPKPEEKTTVSQLSLSTSESTTQCQMEQVDIVLAFVEQQVLAALPPISVTRVESHCPADEADSGHRTVKEVLHHLDLATREKLAELMKMSRTQSGTGPGGRPDPNFGKKLNEARRRIVDEWSEQWRCQSGAHQQVPGRSGVADGAAQVELLDESEIIQSALAALERVAQSQM
jgi:hypothetical protein